MSNYYLIEVQLKTTKSNVSIVDSKIKNWIFSWINNQVIAFSVLKCEGSMTEDIFSLITNTNELNLGLLIDALSMIVNVEVNKSIAISTKIKANVFSISKPSSRVERMVEIINLKRGAMRLVNAEEIGDEQLKRIDDNLTVTLSKDNLDLIDILLNKFEQKNIYQVSDYKLMNYWRKGVDLDNLTLWDESYLAFYKILEYFEKKSNINNSAIPLKFNTKSLKSAYRIAKGGGLRRVTKKQYIMLSDFVDLRNNWDIAHTRINVLPNERESALYFSYYFNIWDYHSHISEITRLMILNHLGINNFNLIVEGGLYALKER